MNRIFAGWLFVALAMMTVPFVGAEPVAAASSCTGLQSAAAVSQLLDSGNAAFEAGDTKNAKTSWLQIRKCGAYTSDYPKALYNLGLLEFKQRDFHQAIEYFEEVLRSHPNDKEPGGSLMQTNRNYSFRSALGISQCYEAMGEFRSALNWAWLAKTKYPYYSWCGTCYSSANFAINKRIAYLALRTSRLQLCGSTLLLGVLVLGVQRTRRRKRDLSSSAQSQ